MAHQHPRIAAIREHDPRYAYEAYLFMLEALNFTQQAATAANDANAGSTGDRNGPKHVSGRQLLDGVRGYAREEFGLMAATVLRLWGVRATMDVGEIVFNLIEAGLLSKTDSDSREDFRDVFDLGQSLGEDYPMALSDQPRIRRGER